MVVSSKLAKLVGTMRILLVEDEIKMARAIRRGLEQEGYAVDAVGDGEEALFRATESDYDGIDRVALLLQAAPDGTCHLDLVLHQQDAHRARSPVSQSLDVTGMRTG